MEEKEINVADFIEMVNGYFEDATTLDLKILKDWMVDQKMNGWERNRFFYFVIQSHKYKKMPTLAYFVDYFGKFKPNDVQRDSKLTEHNRMEMTRWSRFSTARIMEILAEINKKDVQKCSIGDIFFLEKYGRLYTEMRYLQEKKLTRERIREKIESYRKTIEDGMRIVPEDGDNKIDESQIVPFEEVQ